MDSNEFSIEPFENMWYIEYSIYKKRPGMSYRKLCQRLQLEDDDLKKILVEEFSGERHEFNMSYSKIDKDMDRIILIGEHFYKDDSIFFKNMENAQAALDWVEARLLAIKMASDQQGTKQFFMQGLKYQDIRFISDNTIPLFYISKKESCQDVEVSFSMLKERNEKSVSKETDQK